MEIPRLTLFGHTDQAKAQADTDGLDSSDAEIEAGVHFNRTGHAGFFPSVKGLTLEQNQEKESEVFSKQVSERKRDRRPMGSL